MSTHASIGMLLETGAVECIYLHNDGYPSYVVPILTEHYSVIQRVRQLIGMGSCSWWSHGKINGYLGWNRAVEAEVLYRLDQYAY